LQRIASQCEPGELTRFSKLVKIELAYINTSHPDFIGGSRAVAQLMRKLEKEKDAVRKAQLNMDRTGGATPLSSTSANSLSVDDDKENNLGGATPRILNFVFGRGATPAKGNNNNKNDTFRSPVGGTMGSPTVVQLPHVPDTMRQTDAPIIDKERRVLEMEIIKSLIDSNFNHIIRKNFIDKVPKTIMYFSVNHVRDAMQNNRVSELYRDVELPSLMKEATQDNFVPNQLAPAASGNE
jgi:Predicted GTPases (dynamin-related)